MTANVSNAMADGRWLAALAVVLWAVALGVLWWLVQAEPHVSETFNYAQATRRWWAGDGIYDAGIHGFLYQPSSAVLFSPFAFLPPALADFVWRGAITVVFGLGLWQLARVSLGERTPALWGLAMLLTLPMALVNLRGAQTEVLMVGLMMMATADMVRAAWWRAALWLGLAIAFKPQALVLALLFAALYPAMRARLAVAVALGLVLPFLHPDPGYVLDQYRAFLAKSAVAAQPGHEGADGEERNWYDVTAMLHAWGLSLDSLSRLILRLGAAVATLGAAWLACRRLGDRAPVLILALAVTYLMLFNPRTVQGHYMDLAAMLGLFAGLEWWRLGRRHLAVALGFLALLLGSHLYGAAFYYGTDPWLRPLVAVVFAGYLAWRLAGAPPGDRGSSAAPNIPVT